MTDDLAIKIYEAHAARIGLEPKWPKLKSYAQDHWRSVADVARAVVEAECLEKTDEPRSLPAS
jgi:hypothetical protein